MINDKELERAMTELLELEGFGDDEGKLTDILSVLLSNKRVKTGLKTSHGIREFVWVAVSEWPAGEFVGTLAVEPEDCPGLVEGQTMRIADADVFDRVIFSTEEGPIEPALTDIVAQDFGVDLPG